MKYKVYPVLFILTLLGFMSIFGGITDIEDSADDCPSDHLPVTFENFEITSNGNQATVKQFMNLHCRVGKWDDCNSECSKSSVTEYHYNENGNSIVSVLQDGSVVQTLLTDMDYYYDSDDYHYVVENTFTFVSSGDYVIRYTLVCDGGLESTHDQLITIAEGISGSFDLYGLTIGCEETGNRFSFDRSHFNGTNVITIENTNFNLQLNMVAEIDTLLYPCITDGYELNESGAFTSNGDKITISYVDGSATVSQTFDYTYDGQFLTLSYLVAGEDEVVMFFEKQTALAKR